MSDAPRPAPRWRARVEADFPSDRVAVHLGRRLDDETVEVVAPLTLQLRILLVSPAVAVEAEPMLMLDDEMGRALLAALAAHYLADDLYAQVAELVGRVDEMLARLGGGGRG